MLRGLCDNGQNFSIELFVVDEAITMKRSIFLTNKSIKAEILLALINELRINRQMILKCIICDSNGEKKQSGDPVDKENLGITFKYSATSKSQQNG
jgi:hypothetical protein